MQDIHDIIYNMSRQDIEQFFFILSMSDICHFFNPTTGETLIFDDEVPVCQNGPFVQINIKQE